MNNGTGDATFAFTLLGWKARGRHLVPNTADISSPASERIAARVLDVLGVKEAVRSGVPDASTGRPLVASVAGALAADLAELAPHRGLKVHHEPKVISDFTQYEHLERVEELIRDSPELRVTLGTDYLVRPDVSVSLPGRSAKELPLLHAALSCKWTIRSDRVQNIRHDYNLMIRHRRQRLPHLLAVTAEPLPSRLAAIVEGQARWTRPITSRSAQWRKL